MWACINKTEPELRLIFQRLIQNLSRMQGNAAGVVFDLVTATCVGDITSS